MEVKLRYPIVTIEEFLENPFYLGQESQAIYPFWKAEIIDYFKNPNKRNIVLSGSARAGKTFVASIITCRYIYETGAFESFPMLFGLSPSTLPKIMTFSYSKDKASTQLVDRIIRILDQSPFFNQPAYRRKPIKSRIEFPWVNVIAASEVEHSIGTDMLGAVFDEASLRQGAKVDVIKNAQRLFTEIRMRSTATFSWGGRWGGYSVLIATAGETSSFTESIIRSALSSPDSDTKVVIAAQYDVEPQKYATERFDVYSGDDEIRPFIVDEIPDDLLVSINSQGYSLSQFLEVHKAAVAHPPVNLKQFYREDIVYALQQMSGISMSSIESSLFGSPKILDSIFTDRFAYPTRLYIEDLIPFFGIYDTLEPSELIDFDLIESHYNGEPVYGHIDLSTKFDRTGIAFFFYNESTGKIESAFVSSLYHDRRIANNEISQDKILRLIQYLIDQGLNIQYISMDTFGSPGLMQQLRLLYGTQFMGKLSVEDAAPYLEFLALAKRDKLAIYKYPLLRRELSQLVYNKVDNKVDHPLNPTATPSGVPLHSKDCSDAVVGAIFNVITHVDISFDQSLIDERIQRERAKAGEDSHFYEDLLASMESGFDTDQDRFKVSLLPQGVHPDMLRGGFDSSNPLGL